MGLGLVWGLGVWMDDQKEGEKLVRWVLGINIEVILDC